MATLRWQMEGLEELNTRLLKTKTQWANMSAPFKRALLIIFASVKTNFSSGGRPRWAALKSRRGEPLRDTGRLMASVTGGSGSVSRESHSAGRHTLEVGTNVAYANVHQFGFHGRVNQNVRAHSRTITQAFGHPIHPRRVSVKAHSRSINMRIPARPFLLLQESDKADLTAMFQTYLNESLTGGA